MQYAPTFNATGYPPAEQSHRGQSRGRGGKFINQTSKSRTTSNELQYNNSGPGDPESGEYKADTGTGNSTAQSGLSEIHHHVHHHYTHTHTHIHHHHEPKVDVNVFNNFDENPAQQP